MVFRVATPSLLLRNELPSCEDAYPVLSMLDAGSLPLSGLRPDPRIDAKPQTSNKSAYLTKDLEKSGSLKCLSLTDLQTYLQILKLLASRINNGNQNDEIVN